MFKEFVNTVKWNLQQEQPKLNIVPTNATVGIIKKNLKRLTFQRVIMKLSRKLLWRFKK